MKILKILLLFSFLKNILLNEILDLNIYKNFTDFPDEKNTSISFDFIINQTIIQTYNKIQLNFYNENNQYKHLITLIKTTNESNLTIFQNASQFICYDFSEITNETIFTLKIKNLGLFISNYKRYVMISLYKNEYEEINFNNNKTNIFKPYLFPFSYRYYNYKLNLYDYQLNEQNYLLIDLRMGSEFMLNYININSFIYDNYNNKINFPIEINEFLVYVYFKKIEDINFENQFLYVNIEMNFDRTFEVFIPYQIRIISFSPMFYIKKSENGLFGRIQSQEINEIQPSLFFNFQEFLNNNNNNEIDLSLLYYIDNGEFNNIIDGDILIIDENTGNYIINKKIIEIPPEQIYSQHLHILPLNKTESKNIIITFTSYSSNINFYYQFLPTSRIYSNFGLRPYKSVNIDMHLCDESPIFYIGENEGTNQKVLSVKSLEGLLDDNIQIYYKNSLPNYYDVSDTMILPNDSKKYEINNIKYFILDDNYDLMNITCKIPTLIKLQFIEQFVPYYLESDKSYIFTVKGSNNLKLPFFSQNHTDFYLFFTTSYTFNHSDINVTIFDKNYSFNENKNLLIKLLNLNVTESETIINIKSKTDNESIIELKIKSSYDEKNYKELINDYYNINDSNIYFLLKNNTDYSKVKINIENIINDFYIQYNSYKNKDEINYLSSVYNYYDYDFYLFDSLKKYGSFSLEINNPYLRAKEKNKNVKINEEDEIYYYLAISTSINNMNLNYTINIEYIKNNYDENSTFINLNEIGLVNYINNSILNIDKINDNKLIVYFKYNNFSEGDEIQIKHFNDILYTYKFNENKIYDITKLINNYKKGIYVCYLKEEKNKLNINENTLEISFDYLENETNFDKIFNYINNFNSIKYNISFDSKDKIIKWDNISIFDFNYIIDNKDIVYNIYIIRKDYKYINLIENDGFLYEIMKNNFSDSNNLFIFNSSKNNIKFNKIGTFKVIIIAELNKPINMRIQYKSIEFSNKNKNIIIKIILIVIFVLIIIIIVYFIIVHFKNKNIRNKINKDFDSNKKNKLIDYSYEDENIEKNYN